MSLPWLPLPFENVPDDPFYQPRRPLWLPEAMRAAPALPDWAAPARVERWLALLVNPFYPKDPHGSFGKHVLTPSLALTSIASATPAGWRIQCWDENLLQGPPPSDPVPQVVGISVHLTFAERAYELARHYRQRGAQVILGGLHVQSCAEEALRHADAVAVGDGVQLWPRILADAAKGTLQPRYEADYLQPYDAEPPPRRDILPRSSFLTTTSVVATRGCGNRCGFCYLSTQGLRMPQRARRIEDVCQQIKDDGQPYVVFTDNNLGSRPEYLRALCAALEPLQIIWSAAISLDVTDDPSLVRAMALAGCTGVFVGFESLSNENIESAHKRSPRTKDYGRRVRLLQDHGIQVNGSFVVGFDGDRREVFQQTASWIEEHRLECATFHILTPYPGTPLFRELEAAGRLLHRDWSRYDTAHVVFRPRQMEVEELALGYDWLYRKLFSPASIWRRRPRARAAVAPYLAMAYLYKRANWLWHLLIRHRLVHTAWWPLVEWSRRRHLAFRRRLDATPDESRPCAEDRRNCNGKTRVAFTPKQMTQQELFNGYTWFPRRFYSFSSILRRMAVSRTNLAHSLIVNLGYKLSL
jgi:radical SAM superfamily enzyme YgiQ (UPF0313 family)